MHKFWLFSWEKNTAIQKERFWPQKRIGGKWQDWDRAQSYLQIKLLFVLTKAHRLMGALNRTFISKSRNEPLSAPRLKPILDGVARQHSTGQACKFVKLVSKRMNQNKKSRAGLCAGLKWQPRRAALLLSSVLRSALTLLSPMLLPDTCFSSVLSRRSFSGVGSL